MKRGKINKFLCFFVMVFAAILSYMFLKNLLFTDELSSLFKSIQLLIVSAAIGFICSAIYYLIIYKKDLKPYFSKLISFKSLLYQLVRRDFKAKYKRSVLGILWTVLNPLLTMIVMTIVFSTLFRFDIENYPVYLMSGQIIFSLFSESTNMAMTSVVYGGALLKKVSMPKYIFPLSKVISSLINFTLSMIALLIVMLVTGMNFHWVMLLAIVPTLYVFVFSLGIGLILCAAVVFFRDIIYLYGILVTALTYFTPLFYPISIIPEKFRFIISFNPLFHFVEYFRTVTIYGGVPSVWQNIVCLILSLVSLMTGLYIFYKKQDRFILYI